MKRPAKDPPRSEPVDADAPTVTSPDRAPGPPVPGRPGQERFFPGAHLTERYRIVELIGRGGMGEVYRAHDLKLGQPVALKLLPAGFERDPGRLERFFNEVRTARQVTHPNVCRMHDLGEAEGLHFLSMELVDGEDLASLLRRIGHLPQAKALEIARELCAGLAAVHEQGLLHRDLKPANVMIDGRGRARITDFGLAALAEGIHGSEVTSGTPAYMAPEQLAGDEVSVRSEVYSLGLVLYELFTGRAPFQSASMAEMMKQQETATPAPPSSLVDGLDPAVEQLILRCLEKDPARRPGSVHEVAAGLPGGDPLAAAIAAGETPPPDLVAAAGETAGLAPWVVRVCGLGLVAGLLLAVSLAQETQLVGLAPLDKPPEVLIERAREIIRQAGYAKPPRDSAYGFVADRWYLGHIAASDSSPRRWRRLRDELPHPVRFWYRQSPWHLWRFNPMAPGISPFDPPAKDAGMVSLELDPRGRLKTFEAVPPTAGGATGPTPEVDWTPLFRAAGFDRADFEPVARSWVPRVYADRRAAWRGSYDGTPATRIEIQAAAFNGRPVEFRIEAHWDRPPPPSVTDVSSWIEAFHVTWFFAVLLGAAMVARRNLDLGRGDTGGAKRLALFMLLVGVLRWLLSAHHVSWPVAVLRTFIGQTAGSLFWCVALWLFYIAFEPYLRRLWPRMLVSWIRLLDGRFRDPLVGRDVVVGCGWGVLTTCLIRLYPVASAWLGEPPPRPDAAAHYPLSPGYYFELIALQGLRHDLWTVLTLLLQAVVMAFGAAIGILLLRMLLRRTDLALGAFVLTTLGMYSLAPAGTGFSIGLLTLGSIVTAGFLVVLFRFGFLPVVVSGFVDYLLRGSPLTFEPSAWYFGVSLLNLGIILALAVCGLWVALAGRPLFGDDLFAAGAPSR